MNVVRPGIRRVGFVVLVVAVAAASIGGGTITGIASAEPADAELLAVSSPVNNSTTSPPQQENPNQVNEDGNQQALKDWLSSRLSERLSTSAIQISQGQYESAQGLLGEEYRETLSKYVDVAGETQGEGAATAQFNETAKSVSEYARTLEQYRETFAAYQTARENGNAERARQLARELRKLAAKLDRLSGTLTQDYQTLGNSTGTSFQNARTTITNTTTKVTTQTQAVVTRVFTPTSITATATEPGSFVDPIVISGDIESNGTAPLNGTVQVRIGNQTLTAPVSETGAYQLSYRPISAPVTHPVRGRVTYQPNPNGTYLGANTTIRTSVTQVKPAIQVSTAIDSVSYGAPVQATGRVTVGNTPVPNTVVRVRLGRRLLERTTTNASGYYTVNQSLPATIPPGSQSLTVRVGATDTALAPTTATKSVQVQQTETTLTIDSNVEANRIRINGRLQTADGVGIASQTVTIQRNGTLVATVETNASGRLSTSIALPASSASDHILVAASFDGTDTNLAAARAATTITIPRQGGNGLFSMPVLMLAIGGIVVLSLLGSGVYLRTRTEPTGETDSDADTQQGQAESSTSPSIAASEHSTQVPAARLAAAADHLDAGEVDKAVRALYGATRAALSPAAIGTGTHWEFYTTVRDDLDPEARDLLRDATEAYEAVQFAETSPNEAAVEELIGKVRDRLDSGAENRNPNQSAQQSE